MIIKYGYYKWKNNTNLNYAFIVLKTKITKIILAQYLY